MTETKSLAIEFDAIVGEMPEIQQRGQEVITEHVPFGGDLMEDAVGQVMRDQKLGELAAIKVINSRIGEEGTGTTDPSSPPLLRLSNTTITTLW